MRIYIIQDYKKKSDTLSATLYNKGATLSATPNERTKDMINKNNERMTFTFSKKQAEWIRRCAKKCNLQPSQFIKWLIDKNIGRFFAKLTWQDQSICEMLQNDRAIEPGLPLKGRDEISKEEWDKLFDIKTEKPKQENEDELPF